MLKINLKDGESVYLGPTKVTAVHDGSYTILLIEGSTVPVMKESETISVNDAKTLQQRIYYHMQQHYLHGGNEHLTAADKLSQALPKEDLAILRQHQEHAISLSGR